MALIFINLLVSLKVNGQYIPTYNYSQNLLQTNEWSFEENKGQLADENGVVLKDVRYFGRDKDVAIYLRKNKISFVFSKTETKNEFSLSEITGKTNNGDDEKINVSAARMDMEIAGANEDLKIIAESPLVNYNNYYLSNCQDGILNSANYKKLTYKDIYPNIDLVLYAKNGGLKYEFVVFPGGNPNIIKLDWKGTSNIETLANGGIIYNNLLGNLKESKPYIYQNNGEVSGNFKFSKDDNYVGFQIGNYNKNEKLVIDPLLTWATYYGGTGNSQIWGVTTDPDSNVYVTGFTSSYSAIATSGAFQTTHGGATMDVFIVKFNNKGVRQWGTYYGGSGDDYSYGIDADSVGNIYVTGYFRSTSSTLATSGAYQTSFGGGNYDAYVLKFNKNGARQWATFYGGSGDESGRTLKVDNSGNIIVGGNTTSTSGMASSGAQQTSLSGGLDGFVVKFSASGSRLWGTYYGGTGDDYVISITTDASNNVFVNGTTKSSSGIATSGTHQTSFAGGNGDGFILKLNSSGVRQWATYYGGSGEDSSYGIALDASGNIFIGGHTYSTSGMSTSGAHQTSNGGGVDAFLAKFNSSGILQWGTYLGGTAEDAGHGGVGVDRKGNVYLSGWTGSSSGIATSNGTQTSFGGAYDVFVAQFSNSGTRLWSTYYGGIAKDHAYTMNIGKDGSIYVGGHTYGSNSLATSGAHQTSPAGSIDGILIKFNEIICLPPVIKGNKSICAGSISSFTSPKNSNIRYNWTITGGTITNLSYSDSIAVQWTATDSGFVRLITSNTNGCIDTSIIKIIINALPKAQTAGSKSICIGDSVKIGTTAVLGNMYSWKDKNTGLIISTLANPAIKVTQTNTFILTETNIASGCSKKDSLIITALPRPVPVISGTKDVCENTIQNYSVTNSVGNTYFWVANGGTIISGQNTSGVQVNWGMAGAGTIKVTEKNSAGCQDSAILNINVTTKPIADAGISQTLCEGDSVRIGTAPKSGILYSWTSNPSGFLSGNSALFVAPNVTTIFYLKATNPVAGCESLDSVIITINPRAHANFSFKGTCFGINTEFSDSSKINGADSIVAWNWDFGNGISSKLRNPVRPFSAIGKYSVKLKVTTSKGCMDSVTKEIEIVPAANAKFSWVNPSGRNVQFIPDDSTQKNYEWDFGDGSTSTIVKPGYSYVADGKYKVTLKVKNGTGCEDIYSDSVLINTTGINDINPVLKLNSQLYPNPFKNELIIEYNLAERSEVSIYIYNLLGQKIFQLQKGNLPAGSYNCTLNNEIQNLKPGGYLILIQTNKQVNTTQVIKL